MVLRSLISDCSIQLCEFGPTSPILLRPVSGTGFASERPLVKCTTHSSSTTAPTSNASLSATTRSSQKSIHTLYKRGQRRERISTLRRAACTHIIRSFTCVVPPNIRQSCRQWYHIPTGVYRQIEGVKRAVPEHVSAGCSRVPQFPVKQDCRGDRGGQEAFWRRECVIFLYI